MTPPSSNRPWSLMVKDIVAGMVVFFVALPLCLGVASASRAEGLPDAQNVPMLAGIIAGIIGGIVIGCLSNSQTSVSGPAAGLTAVVAIQLANVGSFQAFLVAVILAGLIQVVLGLLRWGALAEFFPSSVIKGLLTAIGIILILKQIPHLLGHDKDPEGDFSFFQPDQKNTFTELIDILNDYDVGAMFIGLSSLLLLIGWERVKWLKQSLVPSALVVVLWGAFWYVVLNRVGGVWEIGPQHAVTLPVPERIEEFFTHLTRPDFSLLASGKVYLAALVIAIVASLETLLNIEAIDKIDPRQRRTNPNRELLAQGVGNCFCGLAGALPVTSVIVRSSANIQAGAVSKLSTIIHGCLLLICVVCIPQVLNLIPLSCLAAILVLTGYKLASPQIIRQMVAHGNERYLPYFATVLGIVFTDLLIGVLIGLAVASVYIIRSNLKRPSRVIHERHISGEVTRIILANQVSFLNRANLLRLLNSIPRGGHVLLDASMTDYIDPDILELIDDFQTEMAPARNITVSLVGFQDRYNLEDRVLYVDYATRELQEKMEPRQVLTILQEGNERFRTGRRLNRDLSRDVTGTAAGQFPLAAVLTCIDSRTPAEIIFDLGLGDIFSIRIAGNVAKEKVLGSLEYACAVAKSKLILVLGHTRCGAVSAAVDLTIRGQTALEATGCDHLDALVSEIQRAIPAVTCSHALAATPEFIDCVAEANVRRTIGKIREQSQVLHRLEQQGAIAIVGGIYDIQSGTVRFLDLPAEWTAAPSTAEAQVATT
jgi:MFS superfamily sulfate permease-like transporter